MILKSLYLNNFRLYEEAYFEFCPEVNWIQGRNAVGKTTLLEAIYLLSTGCSFRINQLANLIRHGASYFFIEAHFVKHGIDQRIRVSYSQNERSVFVNSSKYHSLSSLYGNLFCIVLCPDDMNFIKGAPQERRRLIDIPLGQMDPFYLHHLSRYQRAIRQRNHLLKSKSVSSIDSWEYELATSAAYLLQKRLQYVEDLEAYAQPLHCQIAGEGEELSLQYRPYGRIGSSDQSLRDQYIEQFQRNRSREMMIGTTLVGPHKDDLAISIGNKEARYFVSEGQQRSCAAAIRLGQWEQMQKGSELVPLMLIDDIGASLDPTRCDRLYQYLGGLSQLFLTSTQDLPKPLSSRLHSVISPE